MSTPTSLQSLGFETFDRTIGDCMYTVELLPFRESKAAAVRLMNVIGPAMESMSMGAAKGMGEGDGEDERSQEAFLIMFAGAVGGLMRTMSLDTINYFEGLFLAKTRVTIQDEDGTVRTPVLRDIMYPKDGPGHFAGKRQPHYFMWLAFCLEVNFAPFFSGVAGKLSGLLPVRLKGSSAFQSKSQPASTPMTGESGG